MQEQIKAFYEQIKINPLPADAQAFWFYLKHIQYQQEEFKVTNIELMEVLNISSSQLDRMRKILMKNRLIFYQKQGGRNAGIYRLPTLDSHNGKQPGKQPGKQIPFDSHNGKQTNSFVPEIIRYYHSKFVEKFKEKPTIDGGKDGKLIKGLLGTYGTERLKGLIDKFFDSDDVFIKQSGYTIGVLKTVINRLITNKDLKNHSKATEAVIRAAQRKGVI